MANEKRLIDADALSDAVDKSKRNNPHPQGMIRVNHRNEHDHFLRMILDAPTVDAVEVDALKAWLYEIAMNNVDNYLCEACEEIISRLDGLRVFARERKEGNESV